MGTVRAGDVNDVSFVTLHVLHILNRKQLFHMLTCFFQTLQHRLVFRGLLSDQGVNQLLLGRLKVATRIVSEGLSIKRPRATARSNASCACSGGSVPPST